ncbi:serine protease inhibitor [Petromyzon marinus]|uniref:Angiotensinogen n=1 Tax=Petromyzon marinus TaxID=7757 RepID=K7N848_PETMA|nr:serine protease inhibitor-like [Petromyzon marinus]ADL63122.1 angiotensinogen [Petromyzon marinus]
MKLFILLLLAFCAALCSPCVGEEDYDDRPYMQPFHLIPPPLSVQATEQPLASNETWDYPEPLAPGQSPAASSEEGSSEEKGDERESHRGEGRRGRKDKYKSKTQRIASAVNGLGFRLYKQVLGGAGPADNIFFSPLSIASALGVVAAGANGSTRAELDTALGFKELLHGKKKAKSMKYFARLNSALYRRSAGFELMGKNVVFSKKGLWLYRQFTRTVAHLFKSNVRSVDFGESKEAVELMNAYIEKVTSKKFTDVISDVDTATSLMIVNVIYFKGSWANKFEPDLTKNVRFWVNSSYSMMVPTMHQRAKLSYAQDRKLRSTVIKLPYEGGASMLVIVPHRTEELPKVEESVSQEQLEEWLSLLGPSNHYVQLSLPKFKISVSYDLKAYLSAMGMPSMFSYGADLSRITGMQKLHVDKITHKSVLHVNEEGTEAKAETVVGIMPISMPPTVTVDRPFVVLIYDEKTRAVIFMGRVADPKQ